MCGGCVILFRFRKMGKNRRDILRRNRETQVHQQANLVLTSALKRKGPAQPRAFEGEAASLLPFKFSAELGKPELFLISFLSNNWST